MANQFVDVQTYNDSMLAKLQNSNAFISKANMKFKDFESVTGNKGSSVRFNEPARFVSANGLVVSFEDYEERELTLTTSEAAHVGCKRNAVENVYNSKDFMANFGDGAIAELGSKIETDVAGVCESAPYRFYGDGTTALTTYSQLATALARFRNFGAPKNDTCGFLDDLSVPAIVNNGLGQFTPSKNEKEMMSWELGAFSRSEWYESNLLPTHIAGTEGIEAKTLTVVSTTTDADGAVTAIEFSGCDAANDPASVLLHDNFIFSDGVAGHNNMRFKTFIGHHDSQVSVQFRATATAASTGASNVTVSIYPALQANAGISQNINQAIAVGMQATVLPSHRCGLIYAGNPLFMAMPKMPDMSPYSSAISQDKETGAALRMYWGAKFGEDLYGTVVDGIWGKTLAPDYSMKIVIPL